MVDLKDYATDKTKEEEGVWEDLGEGARVKVGRMNNKKYTNETDKILRPHRRSLRRGTLSDEVIENAMLKSMAKFILLDWEGLTLNGEDIEYSYENCLKILTDYPEFRDQITEIATSFELFKAEEIKEAEKN